MESIIQENPNTEDWKEKDSSIQWIYYDSSTISVPICCKHYEEYRHCIFVNNEQRNKVIEDVKNNWSNGEKMGEYYVCMNCGEIIDTL